MTSPTDAAVSPGQGDLTGHAEGPTWRRAFAWFVFPLTFFGALVVTSLGIDAGWSPALATLPGIVPAALIVIVSERIQPHARSWSRSHGDVRTDLLHMAFSQVLPPPLVDAGLKVSAGVAAVWITQQLGHSLWPSHLPLAAQVAFALALGEFGQYWWHRTCHERAWFWRFHATHHSAPRLWWLNAGRFHPLDTVAAYTLTVLPAVLLGCPPEVVAMITTFGAVHGMFQHANIDLRLGPLNWVFSMAELHRWHHSRALEDANSNYGANIILWDIVFGTRHLPKDRVHVPSDVGFAGDELFPQTYVGQLKTPFVWGATQAALDAAVEAEA